MFIRSLPPWKAIYKHLLARRPSQQSIVPYWVEGENECNRRAGHSVKINFYRVPERHIYYYA